MRFILPEESKKDSVYDYFIDNYMAKGNAAYGAIYLYCLRSAVRGAELSAAEVAARFSLLESDVMNAWRFWAGLGALDLDEKGGTIEFGRKKERFIKKDAPPEYSPEEICAYRESEPLVKALFAMGEEKLGRLLNHGDMAMLLGFYDWLGLNAEVIGALLDYCVQNGRTATRYMEKVAVSWADEGITTLEAARERINLYNRDYRRIMKALGQSGRNPAPAEEKYFKKWIVDMGIPLELIEAACEKGVLRTGKPNLGYADTVLMNWKQTGINTLEDVSAEDARRAAKYQPAPAAKQARPKNRFINFEQRKWDFDELKKREQEYIDKVLKNEA